MKQLVESWRQCEPDLGGASVRASRSRAGYTMVELMVVMAMIIILVSLVFPTIGAVKKRRTIALAQAQLKQVETAIQAYKSQLGFYPPDNPGNPVTNQLFFELSGTTRADLGGGNYSFVTLDGSSQITRAGLMELFGSDAFGEPKVKGFANSSATARGTDSRAAAVNFIPGLLPAQIGRMMIAGVTNNVLWVCSVKWPLTTVPNQVLVVNGPGLNPWRYTSTHPSFNPGSYDLWVDVIIGARVYRVSNWSKEPQIVGSWPPP
jgi:type II secretory pathway pseudopilin PulG